MEAALGAKEQEAIDEVRSIYKKMDELQKAAASAHAAVTRKERAADKAKERLAEAKEAAKKADAEVASFASEQRKAMTKLMGLMAKDPSLGHEFLGKALSMAPETPTAETTTTESQG